MICRALLAVVAVCLLGCEYRPPPTKGQVGSFADSLLLAEHRDWGTQARIWEPSRGPDGRRWWQVDFRGDGGPGPFSVIVDADSGWARLPPADWALRRDVAGVAGAGTALSVIEPGPWILVLAEVDGVREAAAQRPTLVQRVRELNEAAAAAGLAPLHGLRELRGGLQLVYGVRGEGSPGIIQHQRLETWVREQGYAGARWVDLGP